ncbi:MAG TPA: universal stress protein [Candidatus Dormibacteraeota bacterium]|nr:universal stress protein [Candidatus Dormibacteraeota bacterium]
MDSTSTTKAPSPRRILVGLDGSTGSARALTWAIELATALNAEIIAAHIFQLIPPGVLAYGLTPVTVPDEWVTDLRRLFENEWTAPLKASGVRYRAIFDEGTPAQRLIGIANDENVDLIVTGNRGLGGFRELVLGSVSQQLVLHAHVPVVIIPAEHKKPIEQPALAGARVMAAPE